MVPFLLLFRSIWLPGADELVVSSMTDFFLVHHQLEAWMVGLSHLRFLFQEAFVLPLLGGITLGWIHEQNPVSSPNPSFFFPFSLILGVLLDTVGRRDY